MTFRWLRSGIAPLALPKWNSKSLNHQINKIKTPPATNTRHIHMLVHTSSFEFFRKWNHEEDVAQHHIQLSEYYFVVNCIGLTVVSFLIKIGFERFSIKRHWTQARAPVHISIINFGKNQFRNQPNRWDVDKLWWEHGHRDSSVHMFRRWRESFRFRVWRWLHFVVLVSFYYHIHVYVRFLFVMVHASMANILITNHRIRP